MINDPRIIVSLDFTEPKQALRLVERLGPEYCRLKVGKILFMAAGPAFVAKLITIGFDVFLDLKFHDIPTTVAKACAVAADLGVWMVNVHASGGLEMMEQARAAIDGKNHQPKITGVTVLTSLNNESWRQAGFQCSPLEQVVRLAQLANRAGLDGVICSAHEVPILRQKLSREFILVTPGIRPAGTDKNDQQRIMTPAQAIDAGSDYLVIGRPVTQAPEPLQVLQYVEAEINRAKQAVSD